ncbi:hypothetical protein OESDEN_03251 [Oesophagostomum dentatum]|uniref:Uncharacterized protein n=1 Tax=Oesophagostomum dentatum TaxID=61180 RepID=A0A0B1THQ4_OESDE|nr:hypothetical protein OESDEN_03251 [Oesophagostomum dentatum]
MRISAILMTVINPLWCALKMKLLLSGLLVLYFAVEVAAFPSEYHYSGEHRRWKRGQHRIESADMAADTPTDTENVVQQTVTRVEQSPQVIRRTIKYEVPQNPTVMKYVTYGDGNLDLSKFQNMDLSNLNNMNFGSSYKVIQGKPIVHTYTMKQMSMVPGMQGGQPQMFQVN